MGRPNRMKKYFGTFTNKEGNERAAFIAYRSEKGWMVHDAERGNALLPTATDSVSELLDNVNFKKNGKEEMIQTETKETVAA